MSTSKCPRQSRTLRRFDRTGLYPFCGTLAADDSLSLWVCDNSQEAPLIRFTLTFFSQGMQRVDDKAGMMSRAPESNGCASVYS